MQRSGGLRHQALAWILVCLCLGQEAVSASSSLRAHRIQNHQHDLYHDWVEHQSRHDSVEVANATSEMEMLRNGKPIRHLKKKLMRKAKNQRVEDIVNRLGDKIPASVASLVKATSRARGSQPFSEDSLAKARRILNGMVEDAQERLDLKTIECHNFRDRNRGNLEQVVSDQARLGEQLSDLARLLDSANAALKDIEAKTEDLEEELAAAQKAYDDTHNADATDMMSRKDDLAVAEFILKFTICEDKQWPKKVFFQQAQNAENLPKQTNIGVLKCEGQEGNLEFHFEDKKLEAQAQRDLTPGARMKLRKYLEEATSTTSLVQTPVDAKEEEDEDDDDRELKSLEENMPSLVQTSLVQTPVHAKVEDDEDDDDRELKSLEEDMPTVQQDTTATTTAATTTTSTVMSTKPKPILSLGMVHKSRDGQPKEGPPMEGPPPSMEGPPPAEGPPGVAEVPPKCTLGKPNCGLLHDNMSIMWGKFKDQVDELQDKMDLDDKNWEELQKDYNAQRDVLSAETGTLNEQLSEATANQNADREESNKKDEEQRLLEAEYKEVWGECAATMYEILFTDICGVLTVRGEVSKFSKQVPPEKITDCEVSEFIEGECTRGGKGLSCDDECDPHGSTPNCGGTKVLTREIVQQKNKFGIQCPKLKYTRKCNQIRCPVDCMMEEWSGWSKCTKECEGGSMSRSRNLLVKPKNGGASCDSPQDSRPCNVGSCDRDCKLKKWSKWSPCTAACGGGEHSKSRTVKIPTRGGGKCPKPDSKLRLKWKKCNTQACMGDEKCVALMDIFIAIDASGSMRESGFKILRTFAADLVRRFEGDFAGNEAVKVGAILFGNGMILPSGVVSPATPITPKLSFDMKKVAAEIEKTEWQKGFTNMAQLFTKADEMSMVSGRKNAHTQILVISDGKPSFEFTLKQEADKMKHKGVNVVMVETNKNLGKKEDSFVRSLASKPAKANYVHIPGVKTLEREMKKWVQTVLVQSCPRAVSFTKMESEAEFQGFELVREMFWCGEVKEKDVTPHKLLGTVQSPSECAQLVQEQEDPSSFFSYGTEADFNQGYCYMEETKDAECPEGFVEAPTDFYKIRPVGGFE